MAQVPVAQVPTALAGAQGLPHKPQLAFVAREASQPSA